MSNPIHGFNPFRIVATVPRSTVLPHGGTVVSYEVDKTNLSFETIDMFQRAGHQERINSRTYAHSVLAIFDQDRDPRLLHALNFLNCGAPSVAAQLVAVHESAGKATFWLENLLEGNYDAAYSACRCPELRDTWTPELRELPTLDPNRVGFIYHEKTSEQRDEIGLPYDALDRAVLEVGKLYPLGWASRAARQGVRS